MTFQFDDFIHKASVVSDGTSFLACGARGQAPSPPAAATQPSAMKFGKIHRQTVETRMPQWRDHCVDYKALKKAIKKQMAAGVQGKTGTA